MSVAFPDWVGQVYDHPAPDRNVVLFRDLCQWLADAHGSIAVDRVLRYEDLETRFAALGREIGLVGKLPYANPSQRARTPLAYRERYDAKTQSVIDGHVAPTLAAFGYGF